MKDEDDEDEQQEAGVHLARPVYTRYNMPCMRRTSQLGIRWPAI